MFALATSRVAILNGIGIFMKDRHASVANNRTSEALELKKLVIHIRIR